MKNAFAFGGGLFTVFGTLTFLSLMLSLSGAIQSVAGDEFLMLIWAIATPAAIAGVGAVSFFLGTKRFGAPSVSARLYLLGLGFGLALYVVLVLLSSLQPLIPESSQLLLPYVAVFLVCFFAASTARSRAG